MALRDLAAGLMNVKGSDIAQGLSGLGRGLQQSAGVYNPQIFEMNVRREDERRNLIAGVVIRGLETGAIDPQKGKSVLEQLGFGELPVGPTAEVQSKQRNLELERLADAEAQQIWQSIGEEARAKVSGEPVIERDEEGNVISVTMPALTLESEPSVNELANRYLQSRNPALQKRGMLLQKSLTETRQKEPEIVRLQRARDSLPEGDPRRKELDAAISGKSKASDLATLLAERDALPPDSPDRAVYDRFIKAKIEGKPLVQVFQGMTPEQAAKTELVNQGIADMEQLRRIIMPGGEVDRGAVLNLNVPGFAGLPGTEARTAYSLLYNAIEAKLRAESGAAVPEAEVKRIAERFRPSPLDSDDTIRSKMERLDAFLRGTLSRIKGAGEPSHTLPGGAATAVQEPADEHEARRRQVEEDLERIEEEIRRRGLQ